MLLSDRENILKRNLTLIAFLVGALTTGICNAADEAEGIPMHHVNY